MPASLQRSLSKISAVTLLVASLWLLANAVLLPLLARLADAQDQIVEERRLLGALMREARQLTLTPSTPASDGDLLLPTGSDAAVMAALQSRIDSTAAKTSVSLTSVQPRDVQAQGQLQFFALQVAATGSMDALQAFLHAVESGRPALIIRSLDLAPPARMRDAGALLDMRIEVVGAVATGSP
ncbi:MAG: type II secretion system protein M [Hyphomicrobium sp.]|nr:type II secretion system protein M [Hyphomicrobium sp.]